MSEAIRIAKYIVTGVYGNSKNELDILAPTVLSQVEEISKLKEQLENVKLEGQCPLCNTKVILHGG